MRTIIAILVICLCFPLAGAAQLRISSSADSLVFPTTKLGFSRDRSVRISNISAKRVSINSMFIVPFFATQYEFDIYAPAVASLYLDSGESVNFIIRFKPELAG